MRVVKRLALLSVLAVLACPIMAGAEPFPSEVVGFNGPPIDDPATSQEMFQRPEWNTTTWENLDKLGECESSGDLCVKDEDCGGGEACDKQIGTCSETGGACAYDRECPEGETCLGEGGFASNDAYRASGLQTEGAAAEEVFFTWAEDADNAFWVRLSSFNGQERPNPSLHTEGKVRFKMTNRSELFWGEIGLCLGIRETDEVVPQLHDGGTLGDIEWVGVDTTVNGITVGEDGIVNTEATGDDVQEYPVGTDLVALELPLGTAVISPGPNGTIETGTAGDDEERFGYFLSPAGTRVPFPAATFPPHVSPYVIEYDLATGYVTVNGTPLEGGIAGFTGDGDLTTPNSRGTLEHLAITYVSAGPNRAIDFAIDELQFEAPEPDPVLPPTVVAPIIADDVEVVVTDLMPSVDRVELLLNGSFLMGEDVTDNSDVVFTITPAVEGDYYTATQRDSFTSTTSPESAAVYVLPEASPYSFSIVIDEDGNGSCSPVGNWEFVGVTEVDSGPVPRGMNLFTNNGVWQEINIPLDNNDVVMPWYGGDGILDASTSGLWSMDSLWFVIAPGAEVGGPHEVFIDAVQILDESDQVIQTLHDMEDGVNYMQYARGQSTTSPSPSELSTVTSFDGTTSQRLVWTYGSTEADETLGLYHNIGYACGTSPTFPDTAVTMRFHMLCRSDSGSPVAPPEVAGPIIVGTQDSVRVYHEAGATAVQLYINGVPEGEAVTPTGTETDFTGLSLAVGASISATQTTVLGESDLAYPRAVTDMPLPPVVADPIAPGGDEVTITNILQQPFAAASEVTVYVNGIEEGSATPTGETTVVTVGVNLVTGDDVTATQTVNGEVSDESAAVMVGFPAPVLYMAPAAGDDTVRVMDLHALVDSVTVTVDDSTDYSVAVTPGTTVVDVPVSGLTMGSTVVATQALGEVSSEVSASEIVTTNVRTTILCDHFEYDQATYEAAWSDSGSAPRLELSTELDATYPTGEKSLYAAPGAPRVERLLTPNVTPTATEPVIWNVHMYDAHGPGASNVQFAQLNGQTADYWYQHIGMLSWVPQDTNYYQYRAVGNGGPNWIDLTEHDAPMRSIGWRTFTVVHKGDFVDIYVDGLLSTKNLPLSSPTTMDIARIGPGYSSANDAYYDDFCVEIGPVRFEPTGAQAPNKPAVQTPLEDGQMSVTVTAIDEDVTSVAIYAGASQIGSYSGPIDETGTVQVDLSLPLEHLDAVTARATNIVGTTASDPIEVGKGNGDILICIGIRETNDGGPLGTPGGSTGEIEWVGADSDLTGAPQGVAISPSNSWQTLTFDPVAGPIWGFTGDDAITAARGTLEHLAVSVDSTSPGRSTGSYRMYVDNVINVGADEGGEDFVICDFEGYGLEDEVLFQEPTFSGSTAGDLSYPPSYSGVADAFGNPGQAELLRWFWKDTTEERWARITTSSVGSVAAPIIDLTKPIQLDVLLVETCAVGGDMDGDGDVDLADYPDFEACLLGPGSAAGVDCLCADFNEDGDVDLIDFSAFQAGMTN